MMMAVVGSCLNKMCGAQGNTNPAPSIQGAQGNTNPTPSIITSHKPAMCDKCALHSRPRTRQCLEVERKHKCKLKSVDQRESEIRQKKSFSRKPYTNQTNISHISRTWCSCVRSLSWYTTALLVIFYGLTVLPMVTSQWREMPEDTSVHLQAGAIINCQVDDIKDHATEWRQYQDDGNDTTFFINEERFEAPNRFNVINNGFGYSLQVTAAERSDDADYQCAIQSFEKKKVRLTVLVEPDLPVIAINSTDLREGDFVEFRCTSANGNPAPDFQWYRDEINTTAETIPPPAKYGTATSVLVRQLTLQDHNTEYMCAVQNEASPTPKTASIYLTVEYKPVIDLGPHQPYMVIEGDAVTLTCNVNANPAVNETNVAWYRESSLLVTGYILPFDDVTKADDGVYRCEATNEVGTTTQHISLDVLYGPEISLHYSAGNIDGNIVKIHEHQAINITCDVHSNPATSPNNIRFLDNTEVIKLGPVYYIQAVARDDAGNYSCEATTVIRPSDGDMILDKRQKLFQLHVLYSPGDASISVPDLVVKGEPATLTCTVSDPGEPPCYFLWSRLDQPGTIWNGSRLEFPSVELQDDGDYVCAPQNEVGPGVHDMELLDVNERPEWLGSTMPKEKTINITTVEVAEMRCGVRGKPLPVIHWYKDGTLIGDGFYTITKTQEQLEEHTWNVTSTLGLEGYDRLPSPVSLTPDDAGNYTCQALNDLDMIQTDLQLYIQYAPIVEATSEKVAIDRNQSAHMSCFSQSYPSTTFHWYNASSKIVPGGRIHITQEDVGGEFPHQTTLTIYNVSNMDLGDYTCSGCNIMGCNEASIHLTVKDVPDQPLALTEDMKTWESVTLSWTAGFDGGYTQTFDILYRYFDNHSHSYLEEWVPASMAQQFNVTELHPSVEYTFTVYAENVLGVSEPSNSVVTTTEGFVVPMPTNVEYDPKTRLLFFASPSNNYCALIEINGGSQWDVYEECAPAEGSILIEDGWQVRDLRVALCLTRRQDVCSTYEYAEFVGEDLPKETIIIVGCVCGGVVIILTVVLIVLCCKRSKAQKNYDKQHETRQMHPVVSNSAATGVTPGPGVGSVPDVPPLKPTIKGLDNPGLDQADVGSANQQREPGIYATEASRNPRPVSPYGYDRHPNGQPNGQISHRPTSQWSQPPPSYDSQRNLDHYRNNTASPVPSKTHLYLDDPYGPDPQRDHSTLSESGMSTPDPQKPKKVIYEVVV